MSRPAKTEEPDTDQRLRHAMRLMGMLEQCKKEEQDLRDLLSRIMWSRRDLLVRVRQISQECSEDLSDVLTQDERNRIRWDSERIVKDMKPTLDAWFNEEL